METFFQCFLKMAFKRQKRCGIKLRSLFYLTWGVISATWCLSLCNLRLTCQGLEIPLSGSLQWCWCHINWEREGLTIIFQRTYVNSSPLDFSFVIIKIVLTAQREADMMNWSILSHNLHFNLWVSMTWEWETEN